MSISEALARAKEKKVTCRCEKMTVRTAVPPCDHYTDADNRERARAEEKTKQHKKQQQKKKKEKKGDEVHWGRKNMKHSMLR